MSLFETLQEKEGTETVLLAIEIITKESYEKRTQVSTFENSDLPSGTSSQWLDL